MYEEIRSSRDPRDHVEKTASASPPSGGRPRLVANHTHKERTLHTKIARAGGPILFTHLSSHTVTVREQERRCPCFIYLILAVARSPYFTSIDSSQFTTSNLLSGPYIRTSFPRCPKPNDVESVISDSRCCWTAASLAGIAIENVCEGATHVSRHLSSASTNGLLLGRLLLPCTPLLVSIFLVSPEKCSAGVAAHRRNDVCNLRSNQRT